MFAIYTPSGRSFSGPLENLLRVKKTAKRELTLGINQSNPEEVAERGRQKFTGDYAVPKKIAEQYRDQLSNSGQREPVYHAYQIMSSSVRILRAEWSLSKVLEYFRQYPNQVFPIVDSNRQLLGILPRKKFYAFVIDSSTPEILRTKSIADYFLTKDSFVHAAEPVTDIRRIATLLVEKNLDAMPIVEESGRIVGIVSRTDILRCAISDPPLSLWC